MTAPVLGVILAGGQGRRLGGVDKALVPLAGRPLIAHVIERLAPQCAGIVINARGDADRFAELGLPVVGDDEALADDPRGAGPLAGILAGLEFAAATGFDRIATMPCDTPFFPADYAARLMQMAEDRPGAQIICAETATGAHYACGLFPVALREGLRADIAAGARKVSRWARDHGMATAMFETPPGAPDPFTNVNTQVDLAEAKTRLAQ